MGGGRARTEREGRRGEAPLGIDLVRVERRRRLWEGVSGLARAAWAGGWCLAEAGNGSDAFRTRSSSLRPLAGARLLLHRCRCLRVERVEAELWPLVVSQRTRSARLSRSVTVDRGERSLAPLSPVGSEGTRSGWGEKHS